ncbi:MAG: hydantoinase/carbamoylase family amidase [Alphaproteobacteria bacterium]|nr:hydantoinase/carbamoylase family amidase [Alphaproteobacteria bacterium]
MSTPSPNVLPLLRTDGARLWNDLMTLGAIAATPAGGSFRPTATDGDRDARNLFALWARDAGLSVIVDGVGNMFARREGTDPDLPPVLAGSHLDTQMPGGKFDGPLGVLAALEAVRTIERAGIRTRRAIEVVNWTNEEGARFAPGLLGSAAFADRLALDTALQSRDRGGVVLGEELSRIGYRGPAPVGGRPVDSYLELHIEQGPALEQAGITIGAVTHAQHFGAALVTFTGANSHAHTTAMARRCNALAGAARCVVEIESIGEALEPHGRVGAATLDVWPNNRVIVPHRAEVGFLIVHAELAGRDAALDAIAAAACRIAANLGLTAEMTRSIPRDGFEFPADMVALTEQAAADLGYPSLRLPTWTGHDALSMHYACPTALVFVPCRDGWSHSEREWCAPEHATAGADVLANMILRRANR